MKSFKEYLTESKKTYEFRIKVVGDCSDDCHKQIEAALSQFKPSSVSKGKRTPPQIHNAEFPEHKNRNMNVFQAALEYPATSNQVRDLVAAGLGMPLSQVKAMSPGEIAEHDINHTHDESTGKAVVGTPTDVNNHDSLVDEEHKMNFLKELNKTKTTGTQYTGVNDEILAKGAPKHTKETPGAQVKVKNNATNIFTKQVKVPTAKGAI